MRDCHREIVEWIRPLEAESNVDSAGNLHVYYRGTDRHSDRLLIGSHLDTVPDAGAFDGVLGVVLGLALLDLLSNEKFPFGIEIIGFSEEEGVRFGTPFIGSRALVGRLDDETLAIEDARGISIRAAIRQFGLNPAAMPDVALADNVLGYLEFHIEQGPVLEDRDLPLAAVEAIAGQTRIEATFTGHPNHAGTTPMHLRRDAIAGAAEWIVEVEREGKSVPGLVATVGTIQAKPGAVNGIAGEAKLTLDVRHGDDRVRSRAAENLIRLAQEIAARRGLAFRYRTSLNQSSVAMDSRLVSCIEEAMRRSGCEPFRMVSGAGHDAMVMAEKVPSAMMFLRTPGGISHHPEETIRSEDVEKALEAGIHLLDVIASSFKPQSHRTERA